jgi:GT2 family glycosyltransferase
MTVRLVAGAPVPPDGHYDADIILLTLDRADETLAAIASASTQVGVSTHIFVLDQGSSPWALARLTATIRHCPNVTLLAVSCNLGVAGGRNLISGLGHGRVIVALDNDAEFAAPDTVARLVSALDGEPGLAAIGCRIVTHADGSDDLSSWGYPAKLLPSVGESFDTVTYVGAGHAIRRQAWHEAGGYDAKLFFGWEEFDFCLRAIALGWRIRYRGDIVVRHKVAEEQRVGHTALVLFRTKSAVHRTQTWLSLVDADTAHRGIPAEGRAQRTNATDDTGDPSDGTHATVDQVAHDADRRHILFNPQ